MTESAASTGGLPILSDRPRRAAAAETIERIRSALPSPPAAREAIERQRAILLSPSAETRPVAVVAASNTAADIAAVVGTAVDRALGSLAPYGSRGDTFDAVAEIEHTDEAGATTRARLQFRFTGGSNR